MAKVTYANWTQNLRSAWMGDFGGREHLVPGGARLDPAQFNRADAVVVTVGAAAAQGATSITVTALTGAIPSGTVLDFGLDEFARTTAAVAAGATAIPVSALPLALEGGEVATYVGTKLKTVSAGVLLGRTRVERDANTPFGPWQTGDEDVYLLAYDVQDVTVNDACELYRHWSIVKENFLPTASQAALPLAQIRLRYECTRGAN